MIKASTLVGGMITMMIARRREDTGASRSNRELYLQFADARATLQISLAAT